eukprot:1083073-Rhodomonas_salina.1
MPCPPNSDSSPDGSTCICRTGYSGPDGGPCAQCESGTYKDAPGSGACEACPPLTYNFGAASCSMCPVGTYGNADITP